MARSATGLDWRAGITREITGRGSGTARTGLRATKQSTRFWMRRATPARLIPNECFAFDPPPKIERAPLSPGELTKGVELAAAVLKFLGPGAKDKHGVELLDDYDRWLWVGFALHDLWRCRVQAVG